MHRTTLIWLKSRFLHVFFNFNFWPKVTILLRLYSVCMMADLRNRLICRIFGVLSSGFMHITTLIWLKNRFSHVFFFILLFDPKWLFRQGYSLFMIADFENHLICRIFGVFSSGFTHRKALIWLKNSFSHVFFLILIFDPNWLFCKLKAVAFARGPIFIIVSCFFFLSRKTRMWV